MSRIVYGCKRNVVDPSYYVNTVDAFEVVKTLAQPPELLFIDDFENEVISLIADYEARTFASSNRCYPPLRTPEIEDVSVRSSFYQFFIKQYQE